MSDITGSVLSYNNFAGDATLKKRIARLRELENQISDAPWDYAVHPDDKDLYYVFCGEMRTEYGEFGSVLSRYRETVLDPDEGCTLTKEEFEYIAHARTVLPKLLELLKEKGVEL